MRFRKRPKIIEAVAVCNILAGDKHPYWLTRSIKAGKIIITPHKISVLTMNQVKHMEGSGWIAWDTKQ